MRRRQWFEKCDLHHLKDDYNTGHCTRPMPGAAEFEGFRGPGADPRNGTKFKVVLLTLAPRVALA